MSEETPGVVFDCNLFLQAAISSLGPAFACMNLVDQGSVARTRYRCGSGRKGGGSLPRQESAPGQRHAQRSALFMSPACPSPGGVHPGTVAAAQPPHGGGSGICEPRAWVFGELTHGGEDVPRLPYPRPRHPSPPASVRGDG